MQPWQPSPAGKILCLLIALFAMAMISLRAEEPLMTLAMAKNYSAPVTAIPAPTFNLEKKPAPTPTMLKLEDKTEIEFLSRTHLEKQTKIKSGNPLLLVGEDTETSSRGFNLKVGYGEVWHGQSEMEKIPADRQPTSFVYFKAGFSF
jgi:hypothetical protein